MTQRGRWTRFVDPGATTPALLRTRISESLRRPPQLGTASCLIMRTRSVMLARLLLGDLRDGGAAAARHVLNKAPGLPGSEHAGDTGIALCILWTALVDASCLGLGLTLRLPASTVVVILASDRGEHVEQTLISNLVRFLHPSLSLPRSRRTVQPTDLCASSLPSDCKPPLGPSRLPARASPVHPRWRLVQPQGLLGAMRAR